MSDSRRLTPCSPSTTFCLVSTAASLQGSDRPTSDLPIAPSELTGACLWDPSSPNARNRPRSGRLAGERAVESRSDPAALQPAIFGLPRFVPRLIRRSLSRPGQVQTRRRATRCSTVSGERTCVLAARLAYPINAQERERQR